MTADLATILIAGGVFLAFAVAFACAPEGWEEPGVGFHYGPEPFQDAGCRRSESDGFSAPVPFFHVEPNSAGVRPQS